MALQLLPLLLPPLLLPPLLLLPAVGFPNPSRAAARQRWRVGPPRGRPALGQATCRCLATRAHVVTGAGGRESQLARRRGRPGCRPRRDVQGRASGRGI